MGWKSEKSLGNGERIFKFIFEIFKSNQPSEVLSYILKIRPYFGNGLKNWHVVNPEQSFLDMKIKRCFEFYGMSLNLFKKMIYKKNGIADNKKPSYFSNM